MSNPSDPTPETDALTRLTVLEWAHERYNNTVRIAAYKTGEDRASWLEDSAYWLQIVKALSDQSDALAALEARWRKEADEAEADGDICCAVTRRHDADDLAALRRVLQMNDDARQSSPDVRGATGSPRSPQPKGGEHDF